MGGENWSEHFILFYILISWIKQLGTDICMRKYTKWQHWSISTIILFHLVKQHRHQYQLFSFSPIFSSLKVNNSAFLRELFIKKNKLKVMEFSIQIFPPPPNPNPLRWKKNIFLPQFFLWLYDQIWRELWRKIWYLLLLKCLEPKSLSQKVQLTAVISALTPPVMKN